MSSERIYATKVLPKAIRRGLTGREAGGRVRALVVVAGLALTAVGYAEGRLRAARALALR